MKQPNFDRYQQIRFGSKLVVFEKSLTARDIDWAESDLELLLRQP